MARMLFPQDRTAFLFTAPGEPIRMPWQTVLTITTDEAGTTPANILDLDEVVIVGSQVVIGTDGLIPEFWGPNDGSKTLWIQPPVDPAYKAYAQMAATPL